MSRKTPSFPCAPLSARARAFALGRPALRIVIVAALVAAPAAAQNLLQNGRFNSNVGGWTVLGGTGVRSTDDAHGSSSSGSLAITNPQPAGYGSNAFQCINVMGGPVTFRTRYHILANQTATGFVTLYLRIFPTSNCTNAQITYAGGPTETAIGQWSQTSFDTTLPAGTHSVQTELLVAKTAAGGDFVAHFDDVYFGTTCHQTSTNLCLTGNRFGVQATWRTGAGDTGSGTPIPLTSDTGDFWFFGSSNIEVVIKVLDACVVNQRFWVFAGGLTDAKVDLTVTDFETSTVKTYTNPLGKPFQPIQDTNAFATCP